MNEYPKNVCSKEQLAQLPKCFLSEDPNRPLQNAEKDGTNHKYSLHPMAYSVIFIFFLAAIERFTYYGLTYTQYQYLTGQYSQMWSPDLSNAGASSITR